MTNTDLLDIHSKVLEFVLNNHLRDALNLLLELKNKLYDPEVHENYHTITGTYENMLKYSFQYGPDPQRKTIYQRLQQSILELSDKIIEDYGVEHGLILLNRQELNNNLFFTQSLTDFQQVIKQLSYTTLEDEEQGANSDNGDWQVKQLDIASDIFHYLLLAGLFKEKEKAIFTGIIDNTDIDWRVKSVLISAVTLSLLRHFDREKFYILFNLLYHQESELRQRAIFGLLINIINYQHRLPLYPELMNRLKSIPDDRKLQERFLAQLLQYLRARETEKITRKIQDEIVPEVMKIKNELEDKLKLNDLLSKENFEDKNPEWENFFKDAPDVYQKLEQFSQMQTEGSDVFMGAFSMLKHFTFFNELTNWFQPFYGKNLALKEAFQQIESETDINSFVDGLEQSSVLCNSDKYSFCLNIQYLPAEQRNMMLDLFNMEMKAMNEAVNDEITLNVESKNTIVNTQYIQDLYRFFKLHPKRTEFVDIFSLNFDILDSPVLRIIFDESSILKNLAEFYFAKDFYREALTIFLRLNEKANSFELLEKIGFCYQKSGNYTMAIESYHKAELFDRNKVWLQRKLSYCYRKTGQYDKAIEYYQEIIREEPKNIENLIYLGQLYIDLEKYEEALQNYYQVEYEGNPNIKIYRPIGWCNFVLGKYDVAIKYFEKLKGEHVIKSDLLNLGHCYWASGKISDALESYRNALKKSVNDVSWFKKAFSEDARFLSKAGFDELDIALMIDYVLIS